MEILRAKTIDLKQTKKLTNIRKKNSEINKEEAMTQKEQVNAYPRRFVFELTNACNLNCKMCGRNSALFKPTIFNIDWLDKFNDIAQYVEEVTLMGWGEPTIHPQFKEILAWAHKQGLRKYFCTNGMKLGELFEDIFEKEVDLIGVSLDGAYAETNERIRRGIDFEKVTGNIKRITKYKHENNLTYPYINLVFTAMKSNINELPKLVELAHELGVEEVKVVFLTVFDNNMLEESLYEYMPLVNEIFEQAIHIGEKYGIQLKLPHLVGKDPAGKEEHKPCYTAWRDFFLGSDGNIRPCMSTSEVLFNIEKYSSFNEMWNALEYQEHRKNVNGCNMNISCKNCYQSSYANWNKKESFIQIGNTFSPEWQ